MSTENISQHIDLQTQIRPWDRIPRIGSWLQEKQDKRNYDTFELAKSLVYHFRPHIQNHGISIVVTDTDGYYRETTNVRFRDKSQEALFAQWVIEDNPNLNKQREKLKIEELSGIELQSFTLFSRTERGITIIGGEYYDTKRKCSISDGEAFIHRALNSVFDQAGTRKELEMLIKANEGIETQRGSVISRIFLAKDINAPKRDLVL